MAAGIIGALTAAPAVIKGITDIIGRFVPDPAQAAQVTLEMQKLVADREVAAATAAAEIAKAQAETNTAEAQNPSLFVGGWRPFVGWGCGVGLKEPVLGCVATKKRGNSSWQGHVFFIVGADKTHVYGLGGNQADAVNVATFKRSEITSYRWPSDVPIPATSKLPTTVAGAKAGVSEA